jgi:uncharacterized membrane protein
VIAAGGKRPGGDSHCQGAQANGQGDSEAAAGVSGAIKSRVDRESGHDLLLFW